MFQLRFGATGHHPSEDQNPVMLAWPKDGGQPHTESKGPVGRLTKQDPYPTPPCTFGHRWGDSKGLP
jgi:hypothetical protein